MTNLRTRLHARWVIGYAGTSHQIFEDADVVLEGDSIIFVGHEYPGNVDVSFNYGESIISPGFIDLDALSDLDTTILGYDNAPAMLKGRVWPRTYVERGPYEMYTPEELAFQKRFAFAQLIKNGITTAAPIASLFYRAWGETVDEFEAAALAAQDLGLRVYLGPAYRTGNQVVESDQTIVADYDEARGLAELEAAVEFARRMDAHTSPLLRGLLAPDRVETCTAELLRRTALASDEHQLMVRLHCCQSTAELALVREQHGCTPPEWLHRLGFLSARCLLPHGIHLSEDELHYFSKSGATIVHCPLVSARHGGVLRSLTRYKSHGMNMAMGTDTWPPDMILNLQLGVMMNRIAEQTMTSCRSEDLFGAATLGGAIALHRPDLGRLVEGAKADITIIDVSRTLQTTDPIQTLMTGVAGRDVSNVFINGRHVLKDKQLPGFDEDQHWISAQRQFDKIASLYPERTLGHPSIDTIFSSSYPRVNRYD